MKRFFNSFAIFISLALSILSFSCAMGADGSLLIRMPGSQSRETTGAAYKFILELDGPTKLTKEANQGELVRLDNLLIGDYEITCTAKDEEGFFYADGSAKTVVKPNEISQVGLALQTRILEPEIILQPTDRSVNISADGDVSNVNLSINARVNQRGELKFQWYRQSENGQWIEDFNNTAGDDGSVNQNAGQVGSSSNTSIKGYIQKSDSHGFVFKESGEYKVKCVVTNTVGNNTKSVDSRICKIVVKNQSSTVVDGEKNSQDDGDKGSQGEEVAGTENGTNPPKEDSQESKVYTKWSELSTAISGINPDEEGIFYVSGELESESCIDIANKKVIILAASAGCIIKRTDSNKEAFFNIKDNGELTLGGDKSGSLILDGGYSSTTDSIKAQKALITAKPDNNTTMKLNLLSNCTLQNNYNTNTAGASDYEPNSGGAVCFVGNKKTLASGSGVLIDGATIQNCYAKLGAGVYYAAGASQSGKSFNDLDCSVSLRLVSGCLKENNTLQSGFGGGIYINIGVMQMSGGEIVQNKTIPSTSSSMQSSGGGGGIYLKVDSAVVITGGEIKNNTTQYLLGGGICGTASSSQSTAKIFIEKNGAVTICDNSSIDGTTTSNTSQYIGYDNIYPSFYFIDNPATAVTLKRDTENVSIKNGIVSNEQ